MPSRRKGHVILLGILVLSVLGFLVSPAIAATAGTETRISYSSGTGCQNVRPSIGNDWIVWEEDCTGQDRVLAYNYMTGVQLALPNATLFAHAPKIRGTRVTWHESTGGTLSALYYSDLAALHPVAHLVVVPASEKKNPDIDRDAIVWEQVRPPGVTADIMLYNITTSILYNLTPGTETSDQQYPSLGGGRVIWQDFRDGEWDLYFNDTTDWSLHSIPAAPPAGVMYRQPVTDGRSVVWHDDTNYDILLSDFSTTSTIDSNGNPKFNPVVCSTFIAWKEDLSGSGFGPYDIVLYNTATATKEILTDSAAPENAAMVDPDPDLAPVSINDDSRIVWVDDRTGAQDVYMFTYGPITACPIAMFTADTTEGDPPLTVRFTDTSLNAPTHWSWDFGDGSQSSGNPVSHTFRSNGVYYVRLTAATPYCRNTTPRDEARSISVGVPRVGFSANLTEAIAPVVVAFRGTATNSPTNWTWAFGDGGTSTLQNPVHSYAAGTYSVSLEAWNRIGNSTLKKPNFIAALNGMQSSARLAIPGISVFGSGAGQILSVNTTLIPTCSISADKKTLAVYPPEDFGWKNITFLSADPGGFTETPPLIGGRVSTIVFTTNDSQPSMFSGSIGNNLRLNYQYQAGRYDTRGILTTQVWEGVSPTDDPDFGMIISHSNFPGRTFAYTIVTRRKAIGTPSSARLNLSASSAWVTGIEDIASERQKMYIIGEGYNASGDRVGTVIPANFTGNDTVNHVEYFLADIRPEFAFLDKFAFARLDGTGNPFQLITLTAANHDPPPGDPSPVNPGPDRDNTGSSPAVAKAAAAPVPADPGPAQAAQRDPGKTASLYTNPDGVITQETNLQSTDGLATVNIGEGITAKDSAGNPLPSVSIAAILPSEVPSLPDSRVVSFAGRAYELQPDGAAFSPGVKLSFVIPQARWGREYSVMTYDHATGTWQELPGTFDGKTGILTVTVTHFCCFALFEKEIASPVTAAGKNPVPSITAEPPAQPPSSAVSIFFGLAGWATGIAVKNLGLIAVIVVAFAVTYTGVVIRRNRGRL